MRRVGARGVSGGAPLRAWGWRRRGAACNGVRTPHLWPRPPHLRPRCAAGRAARCSAQQAAPVPAAARLGPRQAACAAGREPPREDAARPDDLRPSRSPAGTGEQSSASALLLQQLEPARQLPAGRHAAPRRAAPLHARDAPATAGRAWLVARRAVSAHWGIQALVTKLSWWGNNGGRQAHACEQMRPLRRPPPRLPRCARLYAAALRAPGHSRLPGSHPSACLSDRRPCCPRCPAACSPGCKLCAPGARARRPAPRCRSSPPPTRTWPPPAPAAPAWSRPASRRGSRRRPSRPSACSA